MSKRGLPSRILPMCLFMGSIETANALVDPCTQNKLEGSLDRTVILQPGEAPIAAALRGLGVSADLSTAFEVALQKYIPHGVDDGQRMRVRFSTDPNRFLVPIIVTVCGFAQALQNAEGGATGFNLFGHLPYWFEEEEGRANEVVTKVQPFDTLSSILRQYGATTEEVTAIFNPHFPDEALISAMLTPIQI